MTSEAMRHPPDAAPNRSEATERTWVANVRTGDLDAFEAIFRAYASRLAGFVWTYLKDPDESEEVVQDLFLWIWEHRFEWEVPGTLRSYLFRSAANRALSRLRHRRVQQRFLQRTEPGTVNARDTTRAPAAEEVGEQDLSQALERALATLPERCRTVFVMNRVQHQSYAEIADVLGISPRTVEVHMGRALALLRERLADWTMP